MAVRKIVGFLGRVALFLVIMTGPVYVFLANFAFFEPYIYPLHLLQGNVRKVSPRIIVGPYPDYGLLVSLRGRGVKIVVSLLDSKLIYETSLIRKEKRLSRALGLKDYDFPMDSRQPPGSPLNARALKGIRELLARHPQAKIYIHCYLGKHRVGYVVSMLEKHDDITPIRSGAAPAGIAGNGRSERLGNLP